MNLSTGNLKIFLKYDYLTIIIELDTLIVYNNVRIIFLVVMEEEI